MCKKKNLLFFWGLCYSFSCSVIIIIIFSSARYEYKTKTTHNETSTKKYLYFEEGGERKVNGIPVLDCSGSGNKKIADFVLKLC